MTVWKVTSRKASTLFVRAASRAGAKIMAAQLLGRTAGSFRAERVSEPDSGVRVWDAKFNAEPGDPGILDLRSEFNGRDG